MTTKPHSSDLVQAGVLAPYLRVLQAGGASVERIFQSCHLPTEAISDPGVWLPKAQVYTLTSRAARHTGVAELGAVAGLDLRWSDLGAVGTALKQAASLQEAGRAVRRALGSLAAGADCWVERHGAEAWFCYQPDHRFEVGARQTEQYDLAMLLKLVRWAAGPDWRPAKIRTVGSHGATLHRLEDFADTEVVRDAHVTAVMFPSSLLGKSIARDPGNPPARGGNDPGRSSGTLSSAVERILESLSPHTPTPGLHTMADMLQLHVRQVQRQLRNEHTSYSEIVERVRYRVAARLLDESDLNVKEIAHHLGYSGTNNFTRAFHRLAGMPPSAYRQRKDQT